MSNKYYLITLKNARVYEARDARVNGLPIAGLHMLSGPGRLEFLALPAVPSGGLGSFKSMTGIDTEFDICDPAMPGRTCTLRGRVTSAAARPGKPVPAEPRPESICFVYEHISW